MDEENQKQDLIQPEPTENIVYQPPIVSQPETPDSDQVTSPPQPLKPKGKSKAIILILWIVILVVLFGGGVAVYYYLHKSNTPSISSSNNLATSTNNSNNDSVNLDSTSKTMTAVTNLIASKYPTAEVSDDGQVGTPFYKPAGSGYYVYANKYTDLFIESANENEYPFSSDIKSFLLNNGFKVSSISHPQLSGSTPILISSTVLCTVDGISDEEPIPESYTNFSCSDLADYDSAVENVAPFAQLYKNDSPYINASEVIYYSPIVKDSATLGYRIASVYSTSSPGLAGGISSVYYKKDSSNWIYFAVTYNGSHTSGDTGSCERRSDNQDDQSDPFDSMTTDEAAAFKGMTTCSDLYNFSIGR